MHVIVGRVHAVQEPGIVQNKTRDRKAFNMKDFDVVVIGAGPAGIFTALEMDRLLPEKRVLVVDSGSSIDHRACPARTSGQCAHCKT